MANTEEARQVMIKMICEQDPPADYDSVKKAVDKLPGDNTFDIKSWQWIKSHCKYFECETLKREHIKRPYSADIVARYNFLKNKGDC